MPLILEALYEMGGTGSANAVVRRTLEKAKNYLEPEDWDHLRDGTTRVEKRAHWARYWLVKKGYLQKDAPRGKWELTDKGIKAVEENLPPI